MFEGAYTALVTPLRDGKLDEDRLRKQVAFQLDSGVDGLVPVGTTGESPTLSHAEHNRVVAVVIEAADGKVPVIAGTGSNSTSEALGMTRHAAQAGATASLQVVPYYNKPTQEGLYGHFMTIAEQVDLPLVLYNIPGRSAVALSAQTIIRLAEHPNIVAVKEATGIMDMTSEIAAGCDLDILSGDDSLTLPIMSLGGKGVISVVSNIIPDQIARMCHLALEGDFAEARKHHLKLFPLFKAMFVETNPIPLKTAMRLMGMDTGEMRLPLCELSELYLPRIEQALRDQKLR
ncbi:MAG: 4-hydroxy-tetrahydrodipicolinate synthase [Phycisphaeraceae bacterium]